MPKRITSPITKGQTPYSRDRMIDTIIDFILPHLCPGCQKCMHTPGFCSTCWNNLHFISEPCCLLCGNPGWLGGKDLCRSCRSEVPMFHHHRALWAYGSVSRRIVFALKHGRQRYLASLLASWMLPMIVKQPIDCLVPVPLHQHRLAKRGFNQSAILATAIGRLTGIPVHLHGLHRPLATPSQGGFSAQQRHENVMGAFESTKDWTGQRIMLIDDVFTTGATLNACTLALREAGSHHIYAATLAKVVA